MFGKANSFVKFRHCIIAGAPRSATTSLFRVLSAHDRVIPSPVKQTLFFLNEDYKGTVSSKRERGYSIEEYTRYFPAVPENCLTLESTPDYIYSAGSAKRIYNCLGERVLLVFTLRHPVERLVSTYYHEKQVGNVASSVTLAEFLGSEFSELDGNLYVRQGLYHRYLDEYYDTFGADSICVVFMDEIADPKSAGMRLLSERLSIDISALGGLLSERSNSKYQNRSEMLLVVYRFIRRSVLKVTQKNKYMSKFLSIPISLGSMLYRKLNQSRVVEQQSFNEAQYTMLSGYYMNSYDELERLIGRAVPWRE